MKNKKGKIIANKKKLGKPKKILNVKKTPKLIVRQKSENKTNKKHSGILQNARIVKRNKNKIQKNKNIKKIETKISAFPAEAFFKTKIKVIGIGGGGGSIVSEIGKTLKKATFVVADTDVRSIHKKSGIRYFLFGQDVTHGLGTGADPEVAKRAALQDQEKIAGIFKDQDIVILIASLGGGVGSGATEIFAKTAASFGAITLGIFTLPFKFEGKTKSKIALKSLKDLRNILNVSITIPNEKIFKIIDQNTPITQAFSLVNKNMVSSLESLIDLIYNPGMINIDFADLRSILRGIGNVAFLNTVYGAGKNRAEDVANKILTNPLYSNNNFIADKILFNISGSSDISMFEIEKISRKISDVNPKAKIIFGISKNSNLKNKLKTTLLMTGYPFEKELEPVLEKAKEPIVQKKLVVENKIKIDEKKNAVSAESLDKKLSIIQVLDKPAKKAIRRSALDIKEAQEQEQNKRLEQEQEWEIPTFLRKIKFKS